MSDTGRLQMGSILDAMGTAVLLMDEQGSVEMVNQAALKCLGLDSPQQLLGRRLPEAVPGTESMLDQFSPFSQQQVTLSIRGKSRTLGFSRSEPLPFGGRALLFKDVTRMLELERRRLHAEQLAQVGEMASKLSHEIRNPLANILIGLQTLERQVLLSSDDNQILQQVLQEVRTLEKAISTLLDQARWHDIHPKLMRVGAVVRDCVETTKPQIASRNLKISIDDGPFSAVAVLDEIGMTRILGNLIRNAVDASPPEGWIRVGWRELDPEEIAGRFSGFRSTVVGIFVEDEGPGVPVELRSSIFEPFKTTKEAGTGLGLSVVNELVRELGGVVEAADARGSGGRFEIFFPSGPRYTCWEIREKYPEAALPCRRVHTCPEECAVAKENAGLLCWTVAARTSLLETGDWRGECLECPVYLDANLSAYSARVE